MIAFVQIIAVPRHRNSAFEVATTFNSRARRRGIRHTKSVEAQGILSNDFANAAATAGLRAREAALAEGHAVVFLDESGRYIQEFPDGTKLEIDFKPGLPREAHLEVVRELLAPTH
jgi:hypothetical protein